MIKTDRKIEDIVVDTISHKAKGRKLVLWGGWEKDNKLSEYILKSFVDKFAFFVTVTASLIRKDMPEIRHIFEINNRSNDFYIIVFPQETDKSHEMFRSYGYGANDVFYIHHKPVVVTKKYQDEWGNCVSKLPDKCQVIIEGYGNQVDMGRMEIKKSLRIICGNNCKISMESWVVFEDDFKIIARELKAGASCAPVLTIGDNCKFLDGRMGLFGGKLQICDKCTFGNNVCISAGHGMKITIGKDSMFSHDISVLCGDGHLIFDCITWQSVNSLDKLPAHKKEIKIGEHVWVGLRTVILHGTEIGNGSVIGAGSLVKKSYTNNCIIAGNPARVIRRNIAWSRQPVDENIALCGEEYINLSMEGINGNECM